MDEAGNYIGNLLEWADVTKQRQLEALDAALNTSHAMLDLSVDGNVIHANENFLKLMGYSANDIIGRNYSMFVDARSGNSDEYRQCGQT